MELSLEYRPLQESIKVLVAEDLALNQLLIKTLLEDFGFQYEIVHNGKAALKKLEETSYDIVLMDLQMPVMDGLEAAKRIRFEMKLKVPVLAVTANSTDEDRIRCAEAGMD